MLLKKEDVLLLENKFESSRTVLLRAKISPKGTTLVLIDVPSLLCS